MYLDTALASPVKNNRKSTSMDILAEHLRVLAVTGGFKSLVEGERHVTGDSEVIEGDVVQSLSQRQSEYKFIRNIHSSQEGRTLLASSEDMFGRTLPKHSVMKRVP